jgi:ubiquinone/menaquinone biosynthesis C-methylase UbiE
MNTQNAYDLWSSQYDTNQNKTRDLEAMALREILRGTPFSTCLEIGCGTGKNTSWLIQQAKKITAVDFSGEMLARAKEKIKAPSVEFIQADITTPWTFAQHQYDLITFSLILEHIEALDPIFSKVAVATAPGGYVYIGELHPFKQYAGSKARFDTEEGRHVVNCFTHHLSDFVQPAQKHGFDIVTINEYFDDEDRTLMPRILTLLLRKK